MCAYGFCRPEVNDRWTCLHRARHVSSSKLCAANVQVWRRDCELRTKWQSNLHTIVGCSNSFAIAFWQIVPNPVIVSANNETPNKTKKKTHKKSTHWYSIKVLHWFAVVWIDELIEAKFCDATQNPISQNMKSINTIFVFSVTMQRKLLAHPRDKDKQCAINRNSSPSSVEMVIHLLDARARLNALYTSQKCSKQLHWKEHLMCIISLRGYDINNAGVMGANHENCFHLYVSCICFFFAVVSPSPIFFSSSSLKIFLVSFTRDGCRVCICALCIAIFIEHLHFPNIEFGLHATRFNLQAYQEIS